MPYFRIIKKNSNIVSPNGLPTLFYKKDTIKISMEASSRTNIDPGDNAIIGITDFSILLSKTGNDGNGYKVVGAKSGRITTRLIENKLADGQYILARETEHEGAKWYEFVHKELLPYFDKEKEDGGFKRKDGRIILSHKGGEIVNVVKSKPIDEAVAMPAPAKKRGRPKKNGTAKAVSTTIGNAATKQRRGRPKKVANPA